ncbi:MAG: Peptide-methionine (R)-S-oxide reductase MsrB, partial [uncultured Pseudonocardia sp.]
GSGHRAPREGRQVRRGVARAAHARRVPGAAPGGHRAALHRRVHRHEDRRGLLLPRVRHGAVPQRDEVRLALRLAVVPHPARRRRGDRAQRLVDGREAHRGPVRHLPQPPRARLRGRGLRHPHRPPLLHQLGVAAPDARGV